MHCFEHQSENAIGICKHCNKGICSKCAIDLSHGLACRDSCEEEVENVNALINNSKATYSNMKGANKYFLSAFFAVIGAGILIEELLSKKPLGFGVLMGSAFLGFGIYHAIISNRYSKRIEADV